MSLEVSFVSALIPFMRALFYYLITSPKYLAPPLNTITLGVGISTDGFCGGGRWHKHSDHSTRSHINECSAGEIYLSTTDLETPSIHLAKNYQCPGNQWMCLFIPAKGGPWHSVTFHEELACTESQQWLRCWLFRFKDKAQHLCLRCPQSSEGRRKIVMKSELKWRYPK